MQAGIQPVPDITLLGSANFRKPKHLTFTEWTARVAQAWTRTAGLDPEIPSDIHGNVDAEWHWYNRMLQSVFRADAVHHDQRD